MNLKRLIIALALCAVLAVGAAGAAAPCVIPGVPEGSEPKPTVLADELQLGIWIVLLERAEMIADPSAPGGYREGERVRISSTMYDNDGWISQHITYRPDGRSESKTIYLRTAATGPNEGASYYTGDNKIFARETIEFSAAEDGTAIMTRTITDADGNLQEVHTVQHDENGLEVESTVAGPDGAVKYTTVTQRDAKGRPIVVEVRDAEGVLLSKTEREYDALGALAAETTWTPQEVISSTFESDWNQWWVVRRNYRLVTEADGRVKRVPLDVIYRSMTEYG